MDLDNIPKNQEVLDFQLAYGQFGIQFESLMNFVRIEIRRIDDHRGTARQRLNTLKHHDLIKSFKHAISPAEGDGTKVVDDVVGRLHALREFRNTVLHGLWWYVARDTHESVGHNVKTDQKIVLTAKQLRRRTDECVQLATIVYHVGTCIQHGWPLEERFAIPKGHYEWLTPEERLDAKWKAEADARRKRIEEELAAEEATDVDAGLQQESTS